MKRTFLISKIIVLFICAKDAVAQNAFSCDSSSIILQINSIDSLSMACDLTVKFPVVNTNLDSINVIISNSLNAIAITSISLTSEYIITHSFSENNMSLIPINLSNMMLTENISLSILHYSLGEIICDTKKHYSNLLAD